MSKEGHTPFFYKGLPWATCRYCGLLNLKNYASQWAWKYGCDYESDPAWGHVLKTSVEMAKGRYHASNSNALQSHTENRIVG